MKVLALGGSGAMGRAAVRAALSFDFVTSVVVASIDKDRADAFVLALEDPRASAEYVDVSDAAALHECLSASDVVLNTVGPFYRFGVPILTAAIEAGVHYCDICDDWQPTLEMLALSEQAAAKGVTACLGLGASPGTANMLAVKAGTTLDSVHRLVSAWKLSGAVNEDDGFAEAPTANTVDAAAVHLIHGLAEDIRILKEGEFVDARALEKSHVNLPAIGPVEVWSLGHPEAVTLPRRFTALKECYNGMLGIGPIVASLQALVEQVVAGKLTNEEAAFLLTQDGGREARNEKLAQTEDERIPNIFAYAEGLKNGQPCRSVATLERAPKGGMAAVTGIPLALFLPLLHAKKLQGHGVFAPEEIIPEDEYFTLLDGFVTGGTGVSVAIEYD